MIRFNLITAFCLACCGLSAKTVTTIKTELKNGEEKSFTLDETGQMSFSGRTLLLQKNETDKITSINLENVKNLYIINSEVSDVDQVSSAKINVYPNPVAEILNIEADGVVDVQIISADGRVVMAKKVSHKEEINVNTLSAGIYWVKIGGSTFKIEKL